MHVLYNKRRLYVYIYVTYVNFLLALFIVHTIVVFILFPLNHIRHFFYIFLTRQGLRVYNLYSMCVFIFFMPAK